LYVERDDRRRIFLDMLAAAHAKLVRHLIAERYVDEAEIRIVAEHRPAVGRVGGVELALPDRRGIVRVAGIPVPDQASGTHVKGADDAGLRLCRIVIIDGPADD